MARWDAYILRSEQNNTDQGMRNIQKYVEFNIGPSSHLNLRMSEILHAYPSNHHPHPRHHSCQYN